MFDEAVTRVALARTPEERVRDLQTTMENIKILADIYTGKSPLYAEALEAISVMADKALCP